MRKKLFTFLLALVASIGASWAAPAVAVNGKLPGAFSVSATKVVYFSQGNLRFTRTSTSDAWSTGKFSFMDNQYDYIETSNVSGDYANETAIGLFGWATSNINTPANTNYLPTNTNRTAASYGSGITTANVNWSDNNNAYANYDWGANTGDLGTGWRTLTRDEWKYLFNTRTINGGKGNGKSYTLGQSVNGTLGVVLYPDDYTGATYTGSDWSTFEDAGCVFLPAAGYRDGTSGTLLGSYGAYWSSTSNNGMNAWNMQFGGGFMSPDNGYYRFTGCSVRLVSEIPPMVPAVITSVPTAKIGLVYTGAALTLIQAGEATGGEMQYSLDNSNWSTNLPSGINAVEYTVYYRVVGDANHIDIDAASLNVTIAKAALSVTAEAKDVTFGEAAPAYTASYSGFVNGEDESVLGGALTFDCAYTAGNAAGAYDITPSGLTSGNYAIAFVPGTLTVNKAASVITVVPTAKIGLVYTGAALTLIQAGEATGGEMQYSLDNTNWSTNLPTGIDASDYTVYYRVVGDANHNDIDAASLNVTIAAPEAVIGDPNNADQITAFLDYYNGQNVAALTIDRPVLNNMYNTLCLPFDMDAAQIAASSLNGVEIYELNSVEVVNDELFLGLSDPVNAVVAGRPYIVKYSAASQLDDLDFENVTINNADLTAQAVTMNGVTFKGTFTPFVMGIQNGFDTNGGYLFLGQNDQLFWPNTNNPLKPFRAYFTVNVDAGQAAGMPMRRGMPAHIGQPAQMPTGVDNVQGDKVQSTKVMIDGVLYIIRGEHMYDAQGQVVK